LEFISIASAIGIMKKYLEEYCVGCGLCTAFGKASCSEDEKGFFYPQNGDEEWLEKVCPSGGSQQERLDLTNVWGRAEAVYYGYSKDETVRKAASSGGVITEIASWLLENHMVDGIIHTCQDPSDPTKTISCISTTRQALISRCGSRYSISHPLTILNEIDTTKKYAFIGKPCDVTALNNVKELRPEIGDVIKYTISFFCAGLPSIDAQNRLLRHLGCNKETLKMLRYRGDGWPGFTTAIDKEGQEYKTDYATSWGKILGRDIMKMCRFCLDGIGESADISCGDAWYLTSEKKPDFSEGEGRNVIFARSKKGWELLQRVIADEKIEIQVASLTDLGYMQAYQRDRRASMIDKIIVLKFFGRSTPKWKLCYIIRYGKYINLRRHLQIVKGTLKRVLNGKI
jgi:coenzyme F420 hydrogenase subunit beta